jgi:hypothetical protein
MRLTPERGEHVVGQILPLPCAPADTNAICELVQPELYALELQEGTHVGNRVFGYFPVFFEANPLGFVRRNQADLLASALAEDAGDDVDRWFQFEVSCCKQLYANGDPGCQSNQAAEGINQMILNLTSVM